MNGTELEHIPGYSWKINSTHENNHIRQENAGNNSRRSFPRDDFSISLWVNETNWSDGTTIINFAKGKDTTMVTSGKKNTQTINYLDNNFFKLKDKEANKIFIASKKLIKLFKNDSLDIEFAINNSKKLFILQVRPIFII